MKIYIHTKFEASEVLVIKEQLAGKYELLIGEEILPENRE